MSIREQILADIKEAMKAKDEIGASAEAKRISMIAKELLG